MADQLAALLNGPEDPHSEDLTAAVRQTDDETVVEAISVIVVAGLSERSALRLRTLGRTLLKIERLIPASNAFMALVRSPYRSRVDIFSLGHTLMAYRGLWPHMDRLPPTIGVMAMQTKLDPNDYEAWMNLVQIWLDIPTKLFDPRAVRPAVDAALRLRPDSTDAHYAHAMLHQQSGNQSLAAAGYEMVLTLDPGHLAARFRLWHLMDTDSRGSALDLGPPDPPSPDAFAVSADDGAAARDRFEDFGGVLMRGAVSTGAFDEIVRELEPWMRTFTDAKPSGAVDFSQAPRSIRDRVLGVLESPEISERVFQSLGAWRGAGWLPHSHGVWWLQWHEPDIPRPTDLHQDFPVSADRSDWFTLWMPFVECGPGIAPALQVAACDLRHPLHYREFQGEYINTVPIKDVARYFEPVLIRPRFEPGDLLVFGKTTLHGTFTEPGMPRTRLSFDSRFNRGPSPIGFQDEAP